MRIKPAFTIIEVLIALSLSSIIIFGMMQTYNNVMRYLNTVHEIQNTNRKACLLFNQIERDFSTAFIPPLLKQIKSGKESKDASKKEGSENEEKDKAKESEKEKTPEEKAKEEEENKEKLKIYFIANQNENELSKKINEQKTYPFKSVSFINTNPLQIYDQSRIRVVRVFYELVLDKSRSKGENLCYNLYRRETEDLENFKAKENEFENIKDKKSIVRTHLVADGIKNMFLQYVYQGYKKDDKKQQKKEIEQFILDSWGEKKETKGIVPCRVEMVIYFWDEKCSKSIALQATFPILSFSLFEEKEQTKKEKKDAKQKGKKQENGKQEGVGNKRGRNSVQRAMPGNKANPMLRNF